MNKTAPNSTLFIRAMTGSLMLFIFLVFSSIPALSANRLALVIGNSKYQNTSPLKNPANDAELIASKLNEIGFEVLMEKDVSLTGAQQLINNFAKKIKEIGDDGIVLFYYAGHGIQFNGKNFIVPIDANLQSDTDIILQGINTELILKIIELSGAKTNVVVLDACRNNPFAAVSRSVGNGLARMDSPSGSLIAYSTAPGQVALDGTGKNSPYTQALAEYITDPNLTIEAVFKKVRRKVFFQTEKKQTTWESTSLIEEVYLVDRGDESSLKTPAETRPASVVKEDNFWNQIRDKNDPQLFQTYLQMFPEGSHREIALAQLPRADDATKLRKPQGQKFDYKDEDLDQRFAKFNSILALMADDNIRRAILSYDRYNSWCCKNKKKGPTGKERYISYGLYGLFPINWEQYKILAQLDEKTAKLMETHGSKPETWMDKFHNLPLRQPAFDNLDNATAALINSFLALHPVVQKADKYYSNNLYEFDKAKGARKLHVEIYPLFEKYITAYTKLAGLVLEQMDDTKAQEIDYVALRNGKSWEWYGIKENYYLMRFMLEYERDPKLNKKLLKTAYGQYLANFLEITDFSGGAPAPPAQYSNLINTAGSRMKQMKEIVEYKGKRNWSLDLDVN